MPRPRLRERNLPLSSSLSAIGASIRGDTSSAALTVAQAIDKVSPRRGTESKYNIRVSIIPASSITMSSEGGGEAMTSSSSTGVEGAGSGVAMVGTLGVGLCPGAFRAVIYRHPVSVTKGNT